jgi:hypothetical protein
VAERNKELYEFERMLEEGKDYDARTHPEDFLKGEHVES